MYKTRDNNLHYSLLASSSKTVSLSNTNYEENRYDSDNNNNNITNDISQCTSDFVRSYYSYDFRNTKADYLIKRGGKNARKRHRNKRDAVKQQKIKHDKKNRKRYNEKINNSRCCQSCNKTFPSRSTITSLRKLHSKEVPLINYKSIEICPNCLTSLIQHRRKEFVDSKLLHLIQSCANTVKKKWSTNTQTYSIIDISKLLPFHHSIYEDPLFQSTISNVTIRIMHVSPITSPTHELKSNIIGAKLPSGFQFGNLGTNTIGKPTDADFGLILFDDSYDFLLIGSMYHKMEDMVAFSRKESKLIIQQQLGPRSGASGGIVFPDTNSKSLSSCTQNNHVMLGKKRV